MSKRFIYYDTETTGIKPGKDRLIEIAARDPMENREFCTFVDPECPIPAEASAVSHITDEMVKGAPTVKGALEAFVSFCSGDVILVAHNNDAFDKPMLEGEFRRAGLEMPQWAFADSLKWARKYRSDLPRHNLQTLREAYGIEANQAHRALDDVVVLEKVFRFMIDDLSPEKVLELLQITQPLVRMPFGKFAGKLLADVPKDYILWLMKNQVFEKPENAALKDVFQKQHPSIFAEA